MPVVIDDFEVVANEEEGNQPPPAPAAGNAASSPTVHDIERAIERQCERFARIWAH
jgi:hypothetical protein